MKVKIILFFLVIFMFSNLTFADRPPSWQEFEVKSNNNQYIAEIKAKDKTKGKNPQDWDYQITVFEMPKKALWSCDYDYDGYPEGILSDDGSTFAYINFWYRNNQPVVSIYRNGKKGAVLAGKDFNIPQSKLKTALSHQLWLTEDGIRYKFNFMAGLPLLLEITTMDGKTHIIDVEAMRFL
ncbi:MAG: hypothetical protein Q8O13_08095 [Candidatus Omnitrophota bacterium]|nr:hypothetical protein [Candidatus Omnitrophota bacterium]